MSARRPRSSRPLPARSSRNASATRRVEEAPPGQARRLVDEVTKTAVGEVEPGPRFPDEAVPERLVERVDRFTLRPTARVADRGQVEPAPDDRRGREDWAAVSPAVARRARSTARTPSGIVARARSPAASASTT
jgi:hypothetical protein